MTTTGTTITLSINDPTATRKWLTPWIWYYLRSHLHDECRVSFEFGEGAAHDGDASQRDCYSEKPIQARFRVLFLISLQTTVCYAMQRTVKCSISNRRLHAHHNTTPPAHHRNAQPHHINDNDTSHSSHWASFFPFILYAW